MEEEKEIQSETTGNEKGVGNKNAIAYGLLKGDGVNTDKMTPSEAWEEVNKRRLIQRKRLQDSYSKRKEQASKSPIRKGETIELSNEKHNSGGGRWKSTILEASDAKNGELYLDYAAADSYEHPNLNTTTATYKIAAGIYNQTGDRKLRDHNIDWDNVSSVSGKTFDIMDFLKEKGFHWDRAQKKYVK